jgi:peptide/nickel transport system permease protein
MSLAILSLGLSLSLSIPIGIYSAARQDRLFDTMSSTILYALYSIPSYVMAVPLILLFGEMSAAPPSPSLATVRRRPWS